DRLEIARRKFIERALDLPGARKRLVGIGQVLAVLHVDDRIVTAATAVRIGQVDVDVAAILQLRRPDAAPGAGNHVIRPDGPAAARSRRSRGRSAAYSRQSARRRERGP